MEVKVFTNIQDAKAYRDALNAKGGKYSVFKSHLFAKTYYVAKPSEVSERSQCQLIE